MLLGKYKHRQTGFTIVELLIVIVVIGILAALVLNSFAGAQAKARNTDTVHAVRQFVAAIRSYAVDNGQYPLSNPATTQYSCLGEGYASGRCVSVSGAAFCGTGGVGENISFSNLIRNYMGNVTPLPTLNKQAVNFCGGQFVGGYYYIIAGSTIPFIRYFLTGNVPCGNVPGEGTAQLGGSDNNATYCAVNFPVL